MDSPVAPDGQAPPPSNGAGPSSALRREAAAALQEESAFRAFLRGRWPWVTLAIAGLVSALFGLESLYGSASWSCTLERMGGALPARAEPVEPWRAFTAGWLHAGAGHLLGNLMTLLLVGGELEPVLGAARYGALYLACLVGSEVAHLGLARSGLGVGASGGILGLVAAMLVLAWRERSAFPPAVARKQLRLAAIVLVFNLLGSLRPDVGVLAHLGGVLLGALLAASGLVTFRLSTPWRPARPSLPALWSYRAAAGGLALATLGAFVYGWRATRPWELIGPALVAVPVPGSELTLSVPAATLARRSQDELPDGTGPIYWYGSVALDPLVVGVHVEDMRSRLASVGPSAVHQLAWTRLHELHLGVPQWLRAGGRDVIFLDVKKEGVRHPRWSMLVGDDLVELEASLAPGGPSAWGSALDALPGAVGRAAASR